MTVIARKLRPRRFLCGIVTAWGLVIVGHGLVKSWRSMLALRCLLGIFEAGFFSSCVHLLSSWYIRGNFGQLNQKEPLLLTCSLAEVAKRNAAFYLLGSFIAGFGGILAYGVGQPKPNFLFRRRILKVQQLSKMDGVGGHAGWRWIFILEGTITVAFALVAYFLIVDFPEDAHKSWKFLDEYEIKTVIDRLNRDRLDVTTSPFALGSYLRNALDWKIWCFAANFGLTSVVTYSTAYFLPIVLREGLGFSEAASQCLSTPVRHSSFTWAKLHG